MPESLSLSLQLPGVIYLIMNWLSLYAFAYIDASMFAMVMNNPNPETSNDINTISCANTSPNPHANPRPEPSL